MEWTVFIQTPRSLDVDVAGTQTRWHQHLCEGVHSLEGLKLHRMDWNHYSVPGTVQVLAIRVYFEPFSHEKTEMADFTWKNKLLGLQAGKTKVLKS